MNDPREWISTDDSPLNDGAYNSWPEDWELEDELIKVMQEDDL
jgi:hypothetical protein